MQKTFNITAINQLKDPQKSWQFWVEFIFKEPSQVPQSVRNFFAPPRNDKEPGIMRVLKSVGFPGRTVDSIETNYLYWKKKIANKTSWTGTVNTKFSLINSANNSTENLNVINHVKHWQNAIISDGGNLLSNASFSSSKNMRKLQCNIVVFPLDSNGFNFPIDRKNTTIMNCWPATIGEIQYDMGNEGLPEVDITWNYDYAIKD